MSGIIKTVVGDNVLKDPAHVAVLTVFTTGTRTGNNTGGNNPTSTTHTCKGFIDAQDRKSFKGTLVEDGSVVIQLVGDSIADSTVPTIEDTITIESAIYRIKDIDRDPAAAMYTCLCREV